jgi:hypothetical protein
MRAIDKNCKAEANRKNTSWALYKSRSLLKHRSYIKIYNAITYSYIGVRLDKVGYPHSDMSSPVPIEGAILNRLSQVLARDGIGVFQIGDGTGNLENAPVGARR